MLSDFKAPDQVVINTDAWLAALLFQRDTHTDGHTHTHSLSHTHTHTHTPTDTPVRRDELWNPDIRHLPVGQDMRTW